MNDSHYARNLIDACHDPMFIINPAGKITDVNNALINLTGVSREKLISTEFFDHFTEEQKAREVHEQVFDQGFVINYPLTFKNYEQTEVLCNCSVYKDEQKSILGFALSARIVTGHKRIAAELAEAKSKTQKAERLAEDALRTKQQFLSNISHEIRTPLNAIIGFTKIVLKTDLSAKQKEYLTAIKLSSDDLTILINDLLDLAKTDAGAMTFEHIPFKMVTSLSAMLDLFETKIQDKKLELVKEYDNKIPEILVGDPVRLRQVILNLVSNAIKFTTKGKITLSVNLLNEDEETVTIEFAITDTGIGIAEDKIETIFEVFQQESNGTSRLYGGVGIGLAIVKQLIEPQGGSISVKSKINEGSTFSFVLTFQKAITSVQVEQETAIVGFDREIKNIKVLIVEDVKLNQLLMKSVLADFGFEYDIADNGETAIEKLQTNSYDIILMDLHMPEMNGFEATEYIRNNMNSKIPIIALTADTTTVDLAKCKASGMDDYMSKPVDDKLLFSKIMELVPSKYTKPQNKNIKSIDLNYLMDHTKANPKMMMDMISIYLNQTPPLIMAMKQGLRDKDWNSLQATVHKMIPSFSIMGISSHFENIAIKVQEYANNIQLHSDGIPDLVLQLENVCSIACKELEDEFNIIKNTNS